MPDCWVGRQEPRSCSMSDHTIPYTHWTYFTDRAAAEGCAAELARQDFLCGIDRSVADPSQWLLQAARDVPIDGMIERHHMVEAIVTKHGGLYDGGESGSINLRTGHTVR